MRRSPLVKVPLFSRKLLAGSTTWASLAVSVMKSSCTTKSSSWPRALRTCSVLGSVCAMSSPATQKAFSVPSSMASYICGIFLPAWWGSSTP